MPSFRPGGWTTQEASCQTPRSRGPNAACCACLNWRSHRRRCRSWCSVRRPVSAPSPNQTGGRHACVACDARSARGCPGRHSDRPQRRGRPAGGPVRRRPDEPLRQLKPAPASTLAIPSGVQNREPFRPPGLVRLNPDAVCLLQQGDLSFQDPGRCDECCFYRIRVQRRSAIRPHSTSAAPAGQRATAGGSTPRTLRRLRRDERTRPITAPLAFLNG